MEPRNPPESESQRNLIITLPLSSITHYSQVTTFRKVATARFLIFYMRIIQLVSIHCIIHVSWILNLFKDTHHSVVNAVPIILQHLAVISATLITPIICTQQIPAQNSHATPTKSSLMKIDN